MQRVHFWLQYRLQSLCLRWPKYLRNSVPVAWIDRYWSEWLQLVTYRRFLIRKNWLYHVPNQLNRGPDCRWSWFWQRNWPIRATQWCCSFWLSHLFFTNCYWIKRKVNLLYRYGMLCQRWSGLALVAGPEWARGEIGALQQKIKTKQNQSAWQSTLALIIGYENEVK